MNPTSGVRDVIVTLVAERGRVRSRDVVAATGLSRQAVHRHLSDLVDQGLLIPKGAGRGAYYVGAESSASVFTYELAGLQEDQAWEELRNGPPLATLSGPAQQVVSYAFTELLNNAIDHSRGKRVEFERRHDGKRVRSRAWDSRHL